MGCIVNGPGEMADADYGYVGTGKEQISLYKGHELIKRNINADDSINEVRDLLEKNQEIKVDNISMWSHRKLSYPIEEFDNGTYFIAVFESEPSS